MLEKIGMSSNMSIIILIALYFVIKWAVRNAIEEKTPEISKAVVKGMEMYYEKKMSEESQIMPSDSETKNDCLKGEVEHE